MKKRKIGGNQNRTVVFNKSIITERTIIASSKYSISVFNKICNINISKHFKIMGDKLKKLR